MARRRADAVKLVLVVTAAVGCVAVVADRYDGDEISPMSEERLATELLGNPFAARCTVEQLDEASISIDVLEALVADRSGPGEDAGVLGRHDLTELDEAQAIMWGCMTAPTVATGEVESTLVATGEVESTLAATGEVETTGAAGAVEPVADPNVIVVDGQPPIHNGSPVWAPAPGTVIALADGAAVIAERPVTVVVPFEQMPERATNRS